MAGSLAIGRFRITGEATGPLERRDRHARLIERLGPGRLGSALRRRIPDFGADDERVLVLDRLELDLDGVHDDDSDKIADRIAEGVAVAVARLAGGGAMGQSCSFTSPVARSAALLVALARGERANGWWFADAPDLTHLPLSSAIAVTLRRAPEYILTILATIPAGDRALVLRQLSRIDARSVLAVCAPAKAATGAEEVWTATFAMPLPPDFSDTAQSMLFALAELRSELRADPSDAGYAAVRVRLATIAALRRVDGSPAIAAKLIAAFGARDIARLKAQVPRLAATDLSALVSISDGALADIGAAIAAASTSSPLPGVKAFTRFGGLLMLWPHWSGDWVEDLPAGYGDPANIAAFLGLAALAGKKDSGAAIGDAALRAAFDIDPRASEADLADWLGRVTPANTGAKAIARPHDAVLPPAFRRHRRGNCAIIAAGLRAVDGFARSLVGFDRASLQFLRENLLSTGAQLTIEPGRVHAVLERPKLDVLLAISGQGDRTHALGDGRVLELERRQ